VLHHVRTWLEPSEQFVHGLVSRSRHPAVVVASQAVVHLDRFPIEPLHRLAWVAKVPGEGLRRRVRTTALLALARRHAIGLVHVHFGYRLPEVTGLVARRRLPLVASLHGHDVTAWTERPADHYPAMVPYLDRVIVPSAWFGSQVEARGIPAELVRVVPAGVDTAWFRPSPVPDAPLVVFVGRFVEKKGIDVLAAAWPSVRSAVPGARLRACGYGPLRELLERMGPGVEIVDRPDRARVRAELAAARVVVSPSHVSSEGDAETLLVVNLEAQASGRPVVTTRHGGITEYVAADRTALVVREGDVDELADALIALLRDDGLAQRLGAAGPAHVARWDVRRCVEEVDVVYDELLGG
jgi:glycosyltransferase involved in cell wall biosynthesis